MALIRPMHRRRGSPAEEDRRHRPEHAHHRSLRHLRQREAQDQQPEIVAEYHGQHEARRRRHGARRHVELALAGAIGVAADENHRDERRDKGSR